MTTEFYRPNTQPVEIGSAEQELADRIFTMISDGAGRSLALIIPAIPENTVPHSRALTVLGYSSEENGVNRLSLHKRYVSIDEIAQLPDNSQIWNIGTDGEKMPVITSSESWSAYPDPFSPSLTNIEMVKVHGEWLAVGDSINRDELPESLLTIVFELANNDARIIRAQLPLVA